MEQTLVAKIKPAYSSGRPKSVKVFASKNMYVWECEFFSLNIEKITTQVLNASYQALI